MKVAYLVNQYPLVSHSFIRREIRAVEGQGVTIRRFSIRRGAAGHVDAADADEAARTTVVLDAGTGGLARAAARCAARDPRRFAAATELAARMGVRSDRGLARNLAYLAEACLLVDMFAREEIDHVHAHFGTNSAAVAMLCRELGGPPYSFTVHGPEEFDKAPVLALREKIARSRFVVAISDYGRSQLYRHTRREEWGKVHVVRCGVDTAFLDGPIPPIPAAPRLVSVGRLHEQKGQLVLLEALGRLARAGRTFELVLVGDGELRSDVEAAIARLELNGRVRLAGWADEAAVRREIGAARALVLPSFAEGLPVVIMEALALGRPVVSTFVAGIPELVEPGRNGWLVPAGAVDPLVTALEQVLDAPADRLAQLGSEGRRRVREAHDVERNGAALRALFEGAA